MSFELLQLQITVLNTLSVAKIRHPAVSAFYSTLGWIDSYSKSFLRLKRDFHNKCIVTVCLPVHVFLQQNL